jgi:FkbM family methyltransferase
MAFLDWLATVSTSRERQLRRALGVDHLLQFDGFTIALPPEHALPAYRRAHPTYDRFLPELSRRLQAGGWVVDVGANCADTVAALAEHDPGLHYLCIEADDLFFKYLERNVAAMRAARSSIDITAVQAFVGRSVSGVALSGGAGSRHASAPDQPRNGERIHQARSLDDLIEAVGAAPVKLIKSDVDGFDYDVLDSATRTICRDRPLLYFECQHGSEAQMTSYVHTIDALSNVGYVDWTVFDNFGGLLLRTDRASDVRQLMSYVQRQNSGKASRTIYYWDILAAGDADSELVAETLSNGANGVWRG